MQHALRGNRRRLFQVTALWLLEDCRRQLRCAPSPIICAMGLVWPVCELRSKAGLGRQHKGPSGPLCMHLTRLSLRPEVLNQARPALWHACAAVRVHRQATASGPGSAVLGGVLGSASGNVSVAVGSEGSNATEDKEVAIGPMLITAEGLYSKLARAYIEPVPVLSST